MSSHSIHTQSNSALHDAPRASATVGLFDQAMVTAVVIAIAYIASIMIRKVDEVVASFLRTSDGLTLTLESPNWNWTGERIIPSV